MELIHPDKYTLALRPGIGDWTIAGDQVIIGIGPLGTRRIRRREAGDGFRGGRRR